MTAAGWTLLGAPWDCSGTGRGEEAAPTALRRAGLSALVGHDAGDVHVMIRSTWRDTGTGVLALADTVRAAQTLADAVTELLKDLPDRRPIVVGGDCSILLGIVPALRGAVGRIGLWYVDGHPDYLDAAASKTGETADMVLAVLAGDGTPSLVTLAGQRPMVAPADVVLLGHRTVNLDADSAAEVARLPGQIRRVDAATLIADPAGSGQRAAAWLARTGRGAWLHLDLDVLDPASLPGVTYPQPHGPNWDQLAEAMRPIMRSPRLLGISVADFRPDLDPAGMYAARIVDLLERGLRGT